VIILNLPISNLKMNIWNILSAQQQPWLAIDPKGVIGEPAYELGAWLRNPFPDILKEVNAESLILRRANQLAGQLGFDRDRILAWGLAQAILAAWWSYIDDQPDWVSWLDVAALFPMLP
jgi:streptomycin 6-kinase